MSEPPTPGPVDSRAVAREIVAEISGVVSSAKRETPETAGGGNSSNRWQLLTGILAFFIASGTILGVFGRAFYVTRNEYTDHAQQGAVQTEAFRQTLEQLRSSLRELTLEAKATAAGVRALQLEMATRGK